MGIAYSKWVQAGSVLRTDRDFATQTLSVIHGIMVHLDMFRKCYPLLERPRLRSFSTFNKSDPYKAEFYFFHLDIKGVRVRDFPMAWLHSIFPFTQKRLYFEAKYIKFVFFKM